MKKNMKRWLALLLAVVVVTTTCVFSSENSLWAFENGTTEAPTEVPADEGAGVPGAQSDETIVVPVESEPEQPEAPPVEETPVQPEATAPVEPATSAPTEPEASAPAESEAAAPTNPEANTPADSQTSAPADSAAAQPTETKDPATTKDPAEVTDPTETEEKEIPVEEETDKAEKKFHYEIRYYYDGTEDENGRTVGEDGVLGSVIPGSDGFEQNVTFNEKEYILDHVENEAGQVTENAESNVVRVYYSLVEEEEETVQYQVTIEHILSTDIGRFRTMETVTLTDQDFADGSVNLMSHAYDREGMVCVTDGAAVSLEDFDGANEAYLTINYEIADGWKAVLKSDAAAPASNGPRKARAVYVGQIDDVDIVPMGQIPVTINFVYDDGSIVKFVNADGSNGKNPVTEIARQEGEGYNFTYEFDKIDGYDLDETITSSNGIAYSISYNEATGKYQITTDGLSSAITSDSVDVVFKAQPAGYVIVTRIPAKEVETITNLEDKGTYTETRKIISAEESGKKVGQMTEVEAAAMDGFTAKAVKQQKIAADGNTEVIVEYVRNKYTVKYDTQGGSYVKAVKWLYEAEAELYKGEPAKPGTPGTEDTLGELICTKTEHTHSTGACYTLVCTKEEHQHYFGCGGIIGICNKEPHTHSISNGCYNGPKCGQDEHRHSNDCYEIISGTPAVPPSESTIDPEPTKQGYTFTGWYMDENCTIPAEKIYTGEDGKGIAHDITVYAGWEAQQVNYTVAYFKEVWNNSTNSSDYAYVDSERKTATVGTTVTGSDNRTIANKVGSYHVYGESSSEVVKADGSTVVEVRYKLKRYTYVFDLDNSNASLTMNNKRYTGKQYQLTDVVLGQDIADKWPTLGNISVTRGDNNFYGWDPDNSRSNYITKRFEVTEEMLAGGSLTITYTALWKDGKEKSVEYWLESATNSGTYEKSEKYSQSFISNDDLSAKEIYGFTYNQSKSGINKFYYDRKSCTITYKNVDGTTIDTKSGKFGININNGTYNFTPNRPAEIDSEYTFAGWYENNQGLGDPYKFDTMPYVPGTNNSNAGLVLYAIWEAPERTVTIIAEGSENSKVTVKKGEVVADRIPVPTRPGYTFEGWYTAKEGGDEFDINQPLMEDVTIYAHWTENTTTTYTVRYVVENGAELKDVADPITLDGAVGDEVVVRALRLKDKDGIEYSKYIAQPSEQTVTLKSAASENVIIFKYYAPGKLQYRVRYVYKYTDTEGNVIEDVKKVSDPQSAMADSFLVWPDKGIVNELAEIGYSLEDKNVTGYIEITGDPKQDVVTFNLVPTTFRINYKGIIQGTDPEEGVDISKTDNPRTYTVKELEEKGGIGITLNNPEKEGYNFLGWKTDAKVNGEVPTELLTEVTLGIGSVGNMTFTAVFEKANADYTVVYHYDKKNEGDTQSADVTVPGNGKIGDPIPYKSESRATLGENTYTLVKIDGAGKKISVDKEQNVVHVYYLLDNEGTDPSNPGPDDTPDSWQITITYEASTGGTVTGTTTERHTVKTFDRADDGTIKNIKDTPATPRAAVEEKAKPGYRFVNWTGSNGKTFDAILGIQSDSVLVDTTYTANYTEKDNIQIQYLASTGGTVSVSREEIAPSTGVATGSLAEAEVGYHFVNWTKAVDAETQVEVGTELEFVPGKSAEGIYEEATYTANFEADSKTYYVQYLDNDNFDADNQNVKISVSSRKDTDTKGKKVVFGMTIKGWHEAIDIDGWTFVKADDLTVGTNDDANIVKVYYSRDENGDTIPDKYQVTFTYKAADNQNGTVTGTRTEVKTIQEITRDTTTGAIATVGEKTPQHPSQPSTVTPYEGYKFEKWMDDDEDTYETDDLLKEAVFETDQTFKAYFTERTDLSYTVRYNYSDDGVNYVPGKTDDGKDATFGTTIPVDVEGNKINETNKKTYAVNTKIGNGGVVYGASDGKVSVTAADNVVDVYYLLDVNGPEGKDDNVPDVWEHRVLYDANGGTGTVEDSNIYPADAEVVVLENGFTKANSVFSHWKYDNAELNPDEKFIMPDSDVSLVAQWKTLEVNKNFAEPEADEKGNKVYKLGKKIPFTIDVTNAGNVTLNNVTVTDNLAGAVIDAGTGYEVSGDGPATIAELAVGATVRVNAHFVVTEAEIGNNNVTNSATAKAEDGPEVTDETDPIPMDGVEKGLKITKTITNLNEASATGEDGEKLFTTGDTVNFDIVVENYGNQTLRGIEVEDTLAEAEIVKTGLLSRLVGFVTGTGYTVEGNKAIIDSLAPNGSVTIKAEYVIKESDLGKKFKNAAVAKADDNTPGRGETPDPIPVEDKNPAFTVVKSVVDKKAEYRPEEDSILYTITVENTGNMDLKDVIVTDSLSGAAADPNTGAAAQVTFNNVPAGVTINGNAAKITSLPIGASVTLNCSYEVKRADANATIGNSVTVTGKTGEEGTTPEPGTSTADSVEVQKSYDVVISYVYEGGATATTAPGVKDISENLLSGTPYSYASPEITGYRPNVAVVEGTLNGNVSERVTYSRRNDLSYTVRYNYSDDGVNYVPGKTDDGKDATFGTTIPVDVEGNKINETNKKTYAVNTKIGNGGVVYGASDGKVSVTAADNVVDVYYLLDENGPEGKDDGTPDVWEHHVFYSANGGTGTVEDSNIYPAGWEVTVLPGTNLSKLNSVFAHWKYDNTELNPDDKFTMPNSDVTLVAQWKTLEVNKNFAEPEADGVYKLNQTIPFTIDVRNGGDVTLNNVTVRDNLAGAVIDAVTGNDYVVNADGTATIAELAVGATVTVNAHFVVTEAEIGNNNFANSATAEAEDGPVVTDETDPIPMDEVEKGLRITKTITNLNEASATGENGEPLFTTGDTVKFDIVVENYGNQTLRGIEVEDTLADAEIVSTGLIGRIVGFVQGNGYRVVDGKAVINTLAPEGTVTIQAEYVIQESDLGKRFKNTAVATADDDTPGRGETEDPIPVEDKNPELSVEKSIVENPADTGTEYRIGDTVNYRITVSNTGNMDLENVIVTDMLTGAANDPATGEAPQVTFEAVPAGVTINGNMANIASLPIGATVTLNCSYVVKRADAGEIIANRVTVTGGTNEPGTTPDQETDEVIGKRVENLYTLTIRYMYVYGEEAAPAFVGQYAAGEAFGPIYSPWVRSYAPDLDFVRSGADGMPAQDVEITVIYTRDNLNEGGGEPAPGPAPGPAPAAVTPAAPAAPVAPVPAPPLVPVPEEEVPLNGGEIGENEEGNVTIVPVEEEEVPLTNRDLDNHDCCILHFLLMLAAFIVYAFFTRSMKKRQQRIAELRDQLETEVLKRKLGVADDHSDTV